MSSSPVPVVGVGVESTKPKRSRARAVPSLRANDCGMFGTAMHTLGKDGCTLREGLFPGAKGLRTLRKALFPSAKGLRTLRKGLRRLGLDFVRMGSVSGGGRCAPDRSPARDVALLGRHRRRPEPLLRRSCPRPRRPVGPAWPASRVVGSALPCRRPAGARATRPGFRG